MLYINAYVRKNLTFKYMNIRHIKYIRKLDLICFYSSILITWILYGQHLSGISCYSFKSINTFIRRYRVIFSSTGKFIIVIWFKD